MQQHGRGRRDAFLRTSLQQLQQGFLTLCSALSWEKSGITCLCPPTTRFPPHLSFLGHFSAYISTYPFILSIYLSFQLYICPSALLLHCYYLVTILKGTLLAHYIPYLPLKYMIKMHTDLAKKTILRKSLLGKRPLNICGAEQQGFCKTSSLPYEDEENTLLLEDWLFHTTELA